VADADLHHLPLGRSFKADTVPGELSPGVRQNNNLLLGRLEAISKKGFRVKIAAAARIKPEKYSSISRI
jgi:hypothetical protein